MQRAKCVHIREQTSRAWEGVDVQEDLEPPRMQLLFGLCLGQLGEQGSLLDLLRPQFPLLKKWEQIHHSRLSCLEQTI